jgi:hypothetical protein
MTRAEWERNEAEFLSKTGPEQDQILIRQRCDLLRTHANVLLMLRSKSQQWIVETYSHLCRPEHRDGFDFLLDETAGLMTEAANLLERIGRRLDAVEMIDEWDLANKLSTPPLQPDKRPEGRRDWPPHENN